MGACSWRPTTWNDAGKMIDAQLLSYGYTEGIALEYSEGRVSRYEGYTVDGGARTGDPTYLTYDSHGELVASTWHGGSRSYANTYDAEALIASTSTVALEGQPETVYEYVYEWDGANLAGRGPHLRFPRCRVCS